MIKWGKRIILILLLGGIFCFLLLIFLNVYMISFSSPFILSVQDCGQQKADYILVLGAFVKPDGTPSDMLEDRILQGVALYEAGASDTVLMSGDSENADYDETGKMKEVAVSEGVPEAAIIRDPVGLSTYDSIVRAKEQMHGKKVIIVTQEYHLYRAVYIARKMGLEAYGCSADLRTYTGQTMQYCREIVARGKDALFVFFRPAPKYGTEILFQ